MKIYAMRTRQVAQGHTPSFLDKLDDGLIVFGNDETRLLFWLPGIGEIFRRVEELRIRVEDQVVRNRPELFSLFDRVGTEQFCNKFPEC